MNNGRVLVVTIAMVTILFGLLTAGMAATGGGPTEPPVPVTVGCCEVSADYSGVVTAAECTALGGTYDGDGTQCTCESAIPVDPVEPD